MIINNPYRKQPQAQAARNSQEEGQGKLLKTLVLISRILTHDVVVVVVKMGIQSQIRQGSIKKAMKRGTKMKYKRTQQSAIDGGLAFDAQRDCKVCRAKCLINSGFPTTVPKRAHHTRCPKNRKTQGMSEMTVYVERQAAQNLAANRAPIIAAPPGTPSQNIFEKKITNRTIPPTKPSSTSPSHPWTTKASDRLARPKNLRRELESRMKDLERGDEEGRTYKWALNNKYPVAVGLLVEYMCSLFVHKRRQQSNNNSLHPTTTPAAQEAIARYRQFFLPGSLSFTFPMEVNDQGNSPSPHYHALEGQTILLVDWKLAFPSVDLLCYNCKHVSQEKADRQLEHFRSNFSDKKSMFPIWSHSGLPTWCVAMKYQCLHCKTRYHANDGRLLSLLPADVASAYPVLPRYAAGGSFHLHRDLSDDVESLMKTYANGEYISNKLHRKIGIVFTRTLHTYLARSPKQPFVSIEDFLGGIQPPTGAAIREYFDNAEHCPLTPYGFSNFARYEREMQSVTVCTGENVAFDWTFQTIKNYNLPGAKAVFTGNKGSTNEIIAIAIVPTVKVSEISHLLQQSILKRRQFAPGAVYTDTCPNNDEFWKATFGDQLETRLGLFHLMHRIVETLDPRCGDLYWKCLVQLKKCVYEYHQEDEDGLLDALLTGKFNGEVFTDDDIKAIRHSKRWNQRFTSFLRKVINHKNIIQTRLKDWVTTYRDAADDQGRPVFTRKTVQVTEEQHKKVQLVSDVRDVESYARIDPGPGSRHNLPKWKSKRPESSLERVHGFLAHFGNTGMNKRLADTLTLGGAAEYNMKQRWKHGTKPVGIPSVFVNKPRFYDHSFLQYLNELAEGLGLPLVFADVHKINNDNGEVFLSKYFEAQIARNLSKTPMIDNKRCICQSCLLIVNDGVSRQVVDTPPIVNDGVSRQVVNPPPIVKEGVSRQSVSRQIVDHPPIVAHTLAVTPQNDLARHPTTNFSVLSPPQFAVHMLTHTMLPCPTANCAFVSPQMMAAHNWRSRPNDCCFVTGNHYCSRYLGYLQDKINDGVSVLGKPPHDLTCPRRKGTTWKPR